MWCFNHQTPHWDTLRHTVQYRNLSVRIPQNGDVFFSMKYRVNWCLNHTIHLRRSRDQLRGISTSWNPTPLPQPQFRVASWQLWQLWLTQRGCSWSSCSFYMFLWLRSRPCSLECLELSCSRTHSRFLIGRNVCWEMLRRRELQQPEMLWRSVSQHEFRPWFGSSGARFFLLASAPKARLLFGGSASYCSELLGFTGTQTKQKQS